MESSEFLTMQTKESDFSVCFKDEKNIDHLVTVRARSATHAMILAMEEVDDLRIHPNRIYRVTKEEKA